MIAIDIDRDFFSMSRRFMFTLPISFRMDAYRNLAVLAPVGRRWLVGGRNADVWTKNTAMIVEVNCRSGADDGEEGAWVRLASKARRPRMTTARPARQARLVVIGAEWGAPCKQDSRDRRPGQDTLS